MSKSLKNVVNPDDVVSQYGADTLRLYEMYMGPLEASKPWNTRDVMGVHRFLHRAWRADRSIRSLARSAQLSRDVEPEADAPSRAAPDDQGRSPMMSRTSGSTPLSPP